MWTLFAIGTIGFWVAIILAFILITALIENSDSGGSWSTFVCAVTLVAFYTLGAGQDIAGLWGFMLANPVVVGLAVLAYVIVGAFWSLAKWYFFVLRKRNEFLDDHRDSSRKYTESELNNKIPSARNYKARITSWMFYWPFSALFTVVNEPIKKIFDTIYRRFTASYDKISKRVFMNSEMLAMKKEDKSE